uniref:Uncharacterized protein n=1 Tax=Arion vulgaris TaxID=1028688 RepID=A0A0B7B8I7_9EUPU
MLCHEVTLVAIKDGQERGYQILTEVSTSTASTRNRKLWRSMIINASKHGT